MTMAVSSHGQVQFLKCCLTKSCLLTIIYFTMKIKMKEIKVRGKKKFLHALTSMTKFLKLWINVA